MRWGNEERGIVRVRDAETIEMVAAVMPAKDTMTLAGVFDVTNDGKTAAILMMDWGGTYWWIPRSQD
jgi:hypothetical protein